MSDFSDAVDAIFGDRNIAKDALWRVGGTGEGIPCRVTIAQPDEVVSYGKARAVVATTVIDVRKSEISEPEIGDTVQIAMDESLPASSGPTFKINADPMIDTDQYVWSCEAGEV